MDYPLSYPSPVFPTPLGGRAAPKELPKDSCGMAFIANIDNVASRSTIEDGITILRNMEHRGAVGADPSVGDGVGILAQLADGFARTVAAGVGIELPHAGDYAVGNFFLPTTALELEQCQLITEGLLREHGIVTLGWRDVPVNSHCLSEGLRASEPRHRQLFVRRDPLVLPTRDMFERKLFVARKQIVNRVLALGAAYSDFYCSSLSCRTVVYKGMLLGDKIYEYYEDLRNEAFVSSFVLVHQRFSTNTLPAWRLAHPFRMICHNGEINTVRGNVNWIRARHANMASAILQDDVARIWPIVTDNQSDSACFDNVLELLVQGGYSLAHAMSMLIPEAWEGNSLMSPQRRAFYEYHAALMEPWDGPAAIAFADGKQIGAVLDRNGLRPARYYITTDRRVILASEAGPLPLPERMIAQKHRLQPGKMLLIDLEQKRLIPDEEIKDGLARSHPYQRWLNHIQLRMDDLAVPSYGGEGAAEHEHSAQQHGDNAANVANSIPPDSDAITEAQWRAASDVQRHQRLLRCFGYTREDAKFHIAPMTTGGSEAVGAMGTDTPPAILSDRQPLLSDYFHQLFAQVTNPPIDPIRERIVMSLITFLGPRPNVFHPGQRTGVKRLELSQPIVCSEGLSKIRALSETDTGLCSVTMDITWAADSGAAGMEGALEALTKQAEQAVRDGKNIIILSDKAAAPNRIAIPALLAGAAMHHHLIRTGLRTLTSLVMETGEARTVHHFATLLGFGVEAVNPYLALDIAQQWRERGAQRLSAGEARDNYIGAIGKGLLKVMSKMGISTLQSYSGAQIFEAVGLAPSVMEKWFCGTVSQIGGMDLLDIATDAVIRHQRAFHADNSGRRVDALDAGGELEWRFNGQRHAWSPDSVASLQHAARSNAREKWQEFSRYSDSQLVSLRGLWGFREDTAHPSVALEEVEPVADIVRRFSTGAMSFGSLSREAHSTLAIAMNRVGGKSNTGEGGEETDRFTPLASGDSMRSAIKQVASGRFGVTANYLCNADMIQIKMAQGAKPGEGGQLPGHKVDAVIAGVRRSTAGVGLISPPPHHDIYSIEDLAELIFDLKNINPQADISVKLVAASGVGTVAAGVAKAKADHITISGYDGGTGASPISSIKHAGLPWELGLAEAQQMLVASGLRGRITLQVDGGMRTGRDVVIAALLGADEFGFSTAPLIAAGCLMMRKCHLNTCPVGIATQDPRLRKRFRGTPEHVLNYLFFVAHEVRALLARLGYRSLDEAIGNSSRLCHLARHKFPAGHVRGSLLDSMDARLARLDFSALLAPAKPGYGGDIRKTTTQDHQIKAVRDRSLIERAHAALVDKTRVRFSSPINNSDRAVGAQLSHQVTKAYGEAGLRRDTITVDFEGSAGQSFGAFLAPGITFTLMGESNDYLGKGLSGGNIIVHPSEEFAGAAEDSIIIGNTSLYGATSGLCYVRGCAGERFAVRNAGACAVVEGTGDHCCEYMTGGCVVVLGETGRNVAAGMSGGIAYFWDPDNQVEQRFNGEMAQLLSVEDTSGDSIKLARSMRERTITTAPHRPQLDAARIYYLLSEHARLTGSRRAGDILDNWRESVGYFQKVLPTDYQRALTENEQSANHSVTMSRSVHAGDNVVSITAAQRAGR